MNTWKETLGTSIPAVLGHEIDSYQEAIANKRQGKIEDPVFAEMRLRRGVYGQRYDNGQRYDGEMTRPLNFPCGDLKKGPDTVWDAPGMMRIKIPWGGLTTAQMDRLAEVAEEYSDDILHITTRQDVQLHFVHIEDTPDLMRRLAAVGITTREACGNVVRNVTACPRSGVCDTETFDVTPYTQAVHEFVIGHPDAQNFGRKFKIAFSGCEGPSCGLIRIHNVGCIARSREIDGKMRRGFEFYVAGGLGAVPYQAQLFEEFMPEAEILPTIQAIGRVFARLGEKRNRARARLKFLVKKLGFDEFKRLVLAERAELEADPRWTGFLQNLHRWDEEPLRPATPLEDRDYPKEFEAWRRASVAPQRQEGYAMVTVGLPLGDLTSSQMRALADIVRKFTGDTCRTTIEQNILLRWVNVGDLYALYQDLAAQGLATATTGTIADATACPGTDTCKLGIAASRGLISELNQRMSAKLETLDPAVRNIRVKASGCFNSCGQHHVADIGFWGVSRKIRGQLVPHFQLVIGGQWENNGGSYGLAIGAIPSKNVPLALDRVLETYLVERQGDETFHDYVARVGKSAVRDKVKDLLEVPDFDQDPSYYFDWGDYRRFTVDDLGKGECAGEVVESTEFDLQASEREVFEAQTLLDADDAIGAANLAYRAMFLAAKALTRTQNPAVGDETQAIVGEFRTRLYDTELIFDRYTKGKFADYFFRAHDETQQKLAATPDLARKRIEEAQLFVEAAHACFDRMG
ncbi:MAG: nitrite/sulfite reductase [Myxococcales bacterium]|nr:MAG: nitrite/sulfite reductase [Myxococcales bacterium]